MKRVLVTVTVLTLVIAGCGDDDGESSAASPKVPDAPPEETFAAARGCLKSAGFNTPGGRKSAGDEDAPAYELIATEGAGGPGAVLAIYATEDEALQRLPGIEDNLAKASDEGASGSVEPFGSVLVLWIPDPPADQTREAVLGCLV